MLFNLPSLFGFQRPDLGAGQLVLVVPVGRKTQCGDQQASQPKKLSGGQAFRSSALHDFQREAHMAEFNTIHTAYGLTAMAQAEATGTHIDPSPAVSHL